MSERNEAVIDNKLVRQRASERYKEGFYTDIESITIPPGLDEDTIRLISAKKKEPEWLLEYRLNAFREWLKMPTPDWAKLNVPEIDFQAISYYSSPKTKAENAPKSLDEVDPKILETYEKLGVPLHERERLAGVAVDAVFDSVSVGTTFRKELAEAGVIFCSFSEAVQDHPELVREYLGTVVPPRDNYFAALNAAVFSDGSFVYIPKDTRCPMELSTYFRINANHTGQFERTLIIAEDNSYVSYLEGCTAPMRDENQLHAAVVELIAKDEANINIQLFKTGTPVMKTARAASITLSPNVDFAPVSNQRYPGHRWKPVPPSPGSTPVVFCAVTIPAVNSILWL